MSDTLIGVTGATGAIGSAVAAALAQEGRAQRLVVRDSARAAVLDGAEAVAVPGGYADPVALAGALRGVDALLLVSAAETEHRLDEHRAAVRAAAEAGVGHVVYLSFLGAAEDATFTLARDHHHTEEAIRASGMAHTFLRDSLYLDFVPLMTSPAGVIEGPAGRGRVGAVARADVAAAAAAVLRDPAAHAGVTYELTGPDAFTLAEAAAVLADVSGKPIRFEDQTIQDAYETRMAPEVPNWQIDAWVTTYLAIKRGEMAAVTTAVRDLTGREPRGLRDVVTAADLDHVSTP